MGGTRGRSRGKKKIVYKLLVGGKKPPPPEEIRRFGVKKGVEMS
jgi:hypothetical protein